MSPLEITAVLGLTGWALYKQTRTAQVAGSGRFKTAIIFAVIGLCIGGFDLPSGATGWLMIAISMGLSLVVGVARGRLTRIWLATDGRVMRRGTMLTVGLFLGLAAAKFILGTAAYAWHIDDGQGFGEVLLMIAIMVAVQAELVYRRGQVLLASSTYLDDPIRTETRP
jgi:hypothetical protein